MPLIPLKRLVPGATSAYKKGYAVDNDFRGLQKGGTVQDLTEGVLQINTGTPTATSFMFVGDQSD